MRTTYSATNINYHLFIKYVERRIYILKISSPLVFSNKCCPFTCCAAPPNDILIKYTYRRRLYIDSDINC